MERHTASWHSGHTGLAPPNDLESAIRIALQPGNYTAVLSGKNNTTGVGLVEVYDIEKSVSSALTNVSTRGFVGTDQNVMIGGFITEGGNRSTEVIVRALGPTLSNFGVANALADPTLELRDINGADAGLLDVFSITDEPAMTAGRVNLNTQQAPVLQSILAGTIWDEISLSTVTMSGASAQSAATMAANITSATSTNSLTNKSSIITTAGLPATILPPTSPATPHDNQTVKARREIVPRAISSVSQTRVWNLLIDVVAQSGRYPPGETDPKKFIVEGEQHYWVHVAIDRFTGQVIDRQVEVVKE